MKRLWLSWSTGKDSAWALHRLRQDPAYSVEALFTTLNGHYQRVAMHSVRQALAERQAEAVGLPIHFIPLPWPCSNTDYEALMSEFCAQAQAAGIKAMAFGDLFLEDIRAYRRRQLEAVGIEALFPLWQCPTAALAQEMIDHGLRATLTCVDTRQLGRQFAGRDFDRQLLAELPPEVDPCGEKGEFHTFVSAGPMFRHPIGFQLGEQVEREGFVFTDLQLPPSGSGGR